MGWIFAGLEVIILVAGTAFVAGYLLNKLFPDKAPVETNTVDPVAIEENIYTELLVQMTAQKLNVDSVLQTVQTAKAKLLTYHARVEEVRQEYHAARAANSDESTLNEIGLRFAKAKSSVTKQQTILEEAQKLADDASKTLNETFVAVQEFEQRMEADKSMAALAAAHKVNAEARQQAQDIKNTLSRAGQASKQIHTELESGRAATLLTKGSDTEQELARIAEQYETLEARAELEPVYEPVIVSAPPRSG